MPADLTLLWTKDHNHGMPYGVPVSVIENGIVYSNMGRTFPLEHTRPSHSTGYHPLWELIRLIGLTTERSHQP